MNSALIGIGMRSDSLERKAIAVARRIGTVVVDHGLTGCKTPDAASYIPKARRYAAARQPKPAPKSLGSKLPVPISIEVVPIAPVQKSQARVPPTKPAADKKPVAKAATRASVRRPLAKKPAAKP